MVAQDLRTQTTRAALLDAFKKIALEQGLEAATTEAILQHTGFSKGALYHHFKSKADLAEAVYTAESHGAIRRVLASVHSEPDAISRMKLTCAAWLKEVRKPAVRKMLFEIGPGALGTRRVIEIENSLSLRLFEELLAEASKAGDISVSKPKLAARLINAYVGNAALQSSSDLAATLHTIDPVIDAVIASLER